SENERTAASLLQRLGEQSNRGPFQAVPVPGETVRSGFTNHAPAAPERQRGESGITFPLAPAWDPKLLDVRHRPRRIRFGSTGKAGDDRTLPLQFDFGSGPFNFYAPMAASNQLAIAEGLRNRTDPVFTWMRTNHSGYHYWAGVYNNQNSYVA